jgi:hypothetical protein
LLYRQNKINYSLLIFFFVSGNHIENNLLKKLKFFVFLGALCASVVQNPYLWSKKLISF